MSCIYCDNQLARNSGAEWAAHTTLSDWKMDLDLGFVQEESGKRKREYGAHGVHRETES